MTKVLALIFAAFAVLHGGSALADELDCTEAKPIYQALQPARTLEGRPGPGVFTASARKSLVAEPMGSADGAGSGAGAGSADVPSGSAIN